MTKASDNEFPKVILKPLGLASAPSDASWKLYPMADGVYARSSNSIVGPLGAGGSGAVATDPIWDAVGDTVVGTGANTAARLAIGAAGRFLRSTGTTAAWARESPKLDQWKIGANNTAVGVTLDAAPPDGSTLIVGVISVTGQTSTFASTNTTWTQVKTVGPTTGAVAASYLAIWVGKVSGGAGGTAITFSKPGGNATISVIVLSDITLTPTLGQSASAVVFPTTTTATHVAPTVLPATTAGNLIVFMAAGENEVANTQVVSSIPAVGVPFAPVAIVAGFSLGGTNSVSGFHQKEVDMLSGGLLIAEIT